jgi:hypothetical protein
MDKNDYKRQSLVHTHVTTFKRQTPVCSPVHIKALVTIQTGEVLWVLTSSSYDDDFRAVSAAPAARFAAQPAVVPLNVHGAQLICIGGSSLS